MKNGLNQQKKLNPIKMAKLYQIIKVYYILDKTQKF